MGLFTRTFDPDDDPAQKLCITGKWPDITVTWNDVDMTPGLHSLTLDITAEDWPEVTLRLAPREIQVDADCMASIEAAFRRQG